MIQALTLSHSQAMKENGDDKPQGCAQVRRLRTTTVEHQDAKE